MAWRLMAQAYDAKHMDGQARLAEAEVQLQHRRPQRRQGLRHARPRLSRRRIRPIGAVRRTSSWCHSPPTPTCAPWPSKGAAADRERPIRIPGMPRPMTPMRAALCAALRSRPAPAPRPPPTTKPSTRGCTPICWRTPRCCWRCRTPTSPSRRTRRPPRSSRTWRPSRSRSSTTRATRRWGRRTPR